MTFITIGSINLNSPQQNCGVFIGEINCGGWDANQKQNQGHAAIFGSFNVIVNAQSGVLDSYEMFDGVVNDQDYKPMIGFNL